MMDPVFRDPSELSAAQNYKRAYQLGRFGGGLVGVGAAGAMYVLCNGYGLGKTRARVTGLTSISALITGLYLSSASQRYAAAENELARRRLEEMDKAKALVAAENELARRRLEEMDKAKALVAAARVQAKQQQERAADELGQLESRMRALREAEVAAKRTAQVHLTIFEQDFSSLEHLRCDTQSYDLHLICRDGRVGAHRLVLQGCDYVNFHCRAAIAANASEMSELGLREFSVEAVSAFLDLQYGVRMVRALSLDNLDEITCLADFIGAKRVFNTLFAHLKDELRRHSIDPAAYHVMKIVEVVEHRQNALMEAARRGDVGSLRKLLSNPHVDVNGQDSEKRTALYHAVANGQIACVNHLMSHPDIRPDTPAGHGQTPLIVAAERGNVALLQPLITERTDVNRGDELGRTALFYAATQGCADVVHVLLDCGSIGPSLRPTSRDASPLIMAARGDHVAVVDLLMRYDPGLAQARDREGLTAYDHAQKAGARRCLAILPPPPPRPYGDYPRPYGDYPSHLIDPSRFFYPQQREWSQDISDKALLQRLRLAAACLDKC